MTDQTTQPTEAEVEAQALAAAQAGYEGKARAQAPAAPVETVKTTEQPLADLASSSVSQDPEDDEPNPSADPVKPAPEAALAQQLEDLKAQVRELKASGADGKTVREMHGHIGEINATLKQLTALKTEPAKDDLADAIADAEEKALEYPEIYGQLPKALKAIQARIGQPKAEEKPTPKAEPAKAEVQSGYTPEQLAAIAALDEVHPDRKEIIKSTEYQAWLKAKPAEYQTKVTTSWNPAVVAQPFTDFKAFKAAQKRKQDRLEAAVTEKGVPKGGPTTISDEEAARIGYERAKSKRR